MSKVSFFIFGYLWFRSAERNGSTTSSFFLSRNKWKASTHCSKTKQEISFSNSAWYSRLGNTDGNLWCFVIVQNLRQICVQSEGSALQGGPGRVVIKIFCRFIRLFLRFLYSHLSTDKNLSQYHFYGRSGVISCFYAQYREMSPSWNNFNLLISGREFPPNISEDSSEFSFRPIRS